MDKLGGQILQCLEELRLRTGADFSAFACQEQGEAIIRWKYAVGNKNERFRRIVLRLGKGIAGKVLMSGRPMKLVNYQPKQHDDPREYPILYAEELRSALGVPVVIEGRVRGVLLVGYRSGGEIQSMIVELAEQSAKQMEKLLRNEE